MLGSVQDTDGWRVVVPAFAGTVSLSCPYAPQVVSVPGLNSQKPVHEVWRV